nr:PASTA domain-containing protein [Micromonospora sp. DSM 115978]
VSMVVYITNCVPVPNVVGQTTFDAKNTLRAHGFDGVDNYRSTCPATQQTTTIVSMTPPAGTVGKPGSMVMVEPGCR